MRIFTKQPVSKLGRNRQSVAPKVSSRTNSYYSSRTQEDTNTGRRQEKNRPKPSAGILDNVIPRAGVVLLLIAIISSVIYGLTLTTNPRVIELKVANSKLLQEQSSYQLAASKLFSDSIWNRNKLTINTSSIASQLMKQFPELSAVNITLPFISHRPLVYLTPAQPALILVNPTGSYVLDASGRALVSLSSPDELLKYNIPQVNDNSGFKLLTGQQVISSKDVSFIKSIVAQLAAKQLVVSILTLPPATREVDANIVSKPYIVRFNLQNGDPKKQAGVFLAVNARLTSQGIVPAKYIDVRVPGRAYYQ